MSCSWCGLHTVVFPKFLPIIHFGVIIVLYTSFQLKVLGKLCGKYIVAIISRRMKVNTVIHWLHIPLMSY